MISRLLSAYQAWQKDRNFLKAMDAIHRLDYKQLKEMRDYISALVEFIEFKP